MTTAKEKEEIEELRDELTGLRAEVAKMMSLLEKQETSSVAEIGDKVSEKLGSYQESLQESAESALEIGDEGLKEIGQRIRDNPVASICLAFGVGYIISKVLGQNK